MPPTPLSLAARLAALTGPLGGGAAAGRSAAPARASLGAPGAGRAADVFSELLSQQLGLGGPSLHSGGDSPLEALLGGNGKSGILSLPSVSPLVTRAAAARQGLPAAPAASAAARAPGQGAVAWARGMLGRQDWNNLCQRFVEEAYGTRGVYPNAAAAARELVTHRGLGRLDGAPSGALLYFAPDETNDFQGHAAIYLGNGRMISARPTGVQEESVYTPYNAQRYVGWGAPAAFPGKGAPRHLSTLLPESGAAPSVAPPQARSPLAHLAPPRPALPRP